MQVLESVLNIVSVSCLQK